MGKVYEASTLLAYAKDRVQAYKTFDEQLDALKKALHAVATLGNEFQGNGADSIKDFYTLQVDIVGKTWCRHIKPILIVLQIMQNKLN
ncbi:T7SS effector LXG polymorphic toxin [Priestia megaterium]|jgi:predicted ribonuclease toxin of YeeF-YezG toxin-antitoxin module|uniref:T7SS effector LXG polymorphic toxin n=1 Tax=Priestia megaterium TaxID=1404 RepID=UPI001C2F6126|nr:putative ribonuclease toxin of YeeF-YezG toxin-antitoxin module [Priestia megaterium]